MNQQDITFHVDLDAGVAAIKRDLLMPGGPRISTIRNHNFAILPYPPDQEFRLRERVNGLAEELVALGWAVRSIALQSLLFKRLRAEGPEFLDTLIATERQYHAKAAAQSGNPAEPEPAAALDYLKGHISDVIDGAEGLAADIEREIIAFCDENPDKLERSVIFLGRTGALYPFTRTSGLLRHLTGHTRNLPVVLLYPGTRHDLTSLSFMGVLHPDRDYRPRIYP